VTPDVTDFGPARSALTSTRDPGEATRTDAEVPDTFDTRQLTLLAHR